MAQRPIVSSLLSVIFLALIYILIKSVFIRPEGKGYFSTAYSEWLSFAMTIGELVWTLVSGVVFYLIVPFFYVIFLRPKDILRKSTDGDSFWEKAKDVSFDLKRNYRQY